MNAEELAELFHTTCEALAMRGPYAAHMASAGFRSHDGTIQWGELPEAHRQLMISTSAVVLKALAIPLAVGHFRPGLYRHYKGGYYLALGLLFHDSGRHLMVRYISLKHGSENVRPLEGVESDPDGWLDLVEVDGKKAPRFVYVGQPNDRPLSERW